MKQLDLFGSYEPVTPRPMGEGVTQNKPDNSEKDGVRALTPTKLAHYRAKLAKWETNGYKDVINGETMSVLEIIECDTIHGHNQLGRDMKIVGTLRRLQWTPEAIATYFLTRRIKNNRSAK